MAARGMATIRCRNAAVVVLGAVVIALGAVTYFYQRDIQQARARIARGSEIADTPCGPIEYAVAGQGPPVLVVHGAGGGFDQGLDFARPLAARGFRIIAVSRFGYLRTPLPVDAMPAAQADAHACLLDALQIERATALVLVVPAAYRPRRADAPGAPAASSTVAFLRAIGLRLDFLFWAWIRLAPDSVTRMVLATDPALVAGASPGDQGAVTLVREHILPVSRRRNGLLNEAKVMASLEPFALEHIRAPTLTISARDDLYDTHETARYIAAQVPRARFVGYASGGHLLVGHGPEVMAEITRFLKAQQM